jgi:hypothetical protein
VASEHGEFGASCGVGCVGPEEDHNGFELGGCVEKGLGWQRGAEQHAGLVHLGESGGERLQGEHVLFAVGCREQDRGASVPATSTPDHRGQSGPDALGQQVLGRDAVRRPVEAFTASPQRRGEDVGPRTDHPVGAQYSVDDRGGGHLVEFQGRGSEGVDLVYFDGRRRCGFPWCGWTISAFRHDGSPRWSVAATGPEQRERWFTAAVANGPSGR